MRTSRPRFPSLLSFVCCCVLLAFPANGFAAQVSATPPLPPEPVHRDAVWRSIAEHLPDPATSSAKTLEVQADVLRARRYPDEALVFYKYALARGGDPESLGNKIALTHLQLGHVVLARVVLPADGEGASGERRGMEQPGGGGVYGARLWRGGARL